MLTVVEVHGEHRLPRSMPLSAGQTHYCWQRLINLPEKIWCESESSNIFSDGAAASLTTPLMLLFCFAH